MKYSFTNTISSEVKAAHDSSTPFVPASDGHSPWSTIDSEGFVLGMGLYKYITILLEQDRAKIAGAVLMKELSTALANAGRCTAVGNGNAVGVILYCIGGGTNMLLAVIEYACNRIIGARVVTADGRLITTTVEIGTPSGAHWFMYSLDQAEKHNTAGMVMVMAPPPACQQVLAVAPHFIGDPELGSSLAGIREFKTETFLKVISLF
ncbi:hypothetical protein B0O99DRAFT_671884 [Bisporella sp. PMI_857]|nr:hypothetical protein B0O99DRAFT_671884 [Bisporella sp. PMI_857]